MVRKGWLVMERQGELTEKFKRDFRAAMLSGIAIDAICQWYLIAATVKLTPQRQDRGCFLPAPVLAEKF